MAKVPVSLGFQEVLEAVETLPPEDQVILLEIIRNRLIACRRSELVAEVKEARAAYKRGRIRRGTVSDLIQQISK
jgi:hypothetical protein